MTTTPPTDATRAPGTHAFSVEAGHPCLPGHFPGQPLVPGVMLLEQVAQVLRERTGQRLARVVEVKFLAPLRPDERADIQVSGEATSWRFEIRRGETLLARGRIEGAA